MSADGFYKKHKQIIRWSVRLVILALSIFFLIGGPLPDHAVRWIPALSPLAALSSTLAHQVWYVSLVWSLPALGILLLCLWKGRFFCRWICPLGTLYSVPSQFSAKKRILPWKLNGYLFWFTVSASIAGLPLILFLDPLSTFTRFGVLGQGTAHVMAWIPGGIIPFFLLLSFVQPHIWCVQLCPMGYMVEKLKVKTPQTDKSIKSSRREILTGLVLGVPAAMVFKQNARAEHPPVLPPGAKNLDDFAATCMRCYACVNVCPTGVLTVRKEGGLAEFCLPEMDFDRMDGSYCEQYCNVCTTVCPTGAIRFLNEDEKQQRKIATARIRRGACLAWEDRQECMACDEFCGYNAIEMHEGKDGIPLPEINPLKCRGCGACRNICPAIDRGNAIEMTPLTTQTMITAADDESSIEHGRRRRRWAL
ncbi:4Fe-4S dicluster domain-containing protein [Verrucomicrobia bacterium S94]|nr:4Fe-4S dicluster domain-containing protein [Verrucomicrobia bacterium S94]